MPSDIASDPAPSLQVEKIACVNNAGFVMRFSVQGPSLETPSTGDYPINQTREIDLSPYYILEGTPVEPVVHAVAGKTKKGAPVLFARNGLTAVYSVTGATLDFSVKLIS